MKIVCGACGAKYSIADEKVQGKVFKIRCKKCSNVIVVKGSADGEDAVADGADGGAAEWYVVIDGDQLGPVTSVEIDSYFMSGRINGETFTWRDGLPDWVPLSTLTDFAHLTAHTAGPEEATQISDGYSQMAASQEEDATVAMTAKADAFADPSPAQESSFGAESGGLGGGESGYSAGDFDAGFSDFGGGSPSADAGSGFGAFDGGNAGFDSGAAGFDGGATELHSGGGAQDAGGGGMFASFDSGGGGNDFLGFSSGGSAAVEPAAPAPEPDHGANGTNGDDQANNMIGQRNENSVLFSLSSLDQVQSVGPAPSSGPSLSVSAGGDTPITEGSGLIDIRALATAHSQMSATGPGADDNLDPFSAGTMAMPALMPMGSHRSNKPLIVGGVVAVVALLAIAGVAIALLLSKDDTPAQPLVVEKHIYVEKEGPSADAEKKKADDAAEAKAAADAAALKAAVPNESDTETAKADPSKDKKNKKTTTKKKTGSSSSTAAPDKPVVKKKKKGGDGIDDLLAGLEEKEAKKKTPAKKKDPAPSSSGSGKLTKKQIQSTVRSRAGRVRTCYTKSNRNNLDGTMWVGFTIKPNGKVQNVKIKTGKFAGTDVGKCVVKAVKGIKFPTSSESSTINKYPFKLK